MVFLKRHKKQTPVEGFALSAIPICIETVLCQKGQAFAENLDTSISNPKNMSSQNVNKQKNSPTPSPSPKGRRIRKTLIAFFLPSPWGKGRGWGVWEVRKWNWKKILVLFLIIATVTTSFILFPSQSKATWFGGGETGTWNYRNYPHSMILFSYKFC